MWQEGGSAGEVRIRWPYIGDRVSLKKTKVNLTLKKKLHQSEDFFNRKSRLIIGDLACFTKKWRL